MNLNGSSSSEATATSALPPSCGLFLKGLASSRLLLLEEEALLFFAGGSFGSLYFLGWENVTTGSGSSFSYEAKEIEFQYFPDKLSTKRHAGK